MFTSSYNHVCNTIQRFCKADVQLPNGTRKDKADLALAMLTHTHAMLDVAYQRKPTAHDINCLVS